MHHATARAVCLLALLTVGCQVSLDVPQDAKLDCTRDSDCTAGLRCVVGLGRCAKPGVACVEEKAGTYYVAADGNACVQEGGAAGICVVGACLQSRCGDGVIVRPGEACDDGPANADRPDACRTTCQLPRCGDGIVDTGEACDDGAANASAKDACRPNCELPRCGDGITDTGEQCDDGAANGDRPNACRTTCKAPRCGDGVVDSGEQCDAGAANADAADACRTDCQSPRCGDGIVDSGEECDDANQSNTDDCLNTCKLAVCGDGYVDTGVEACDDGNNNPFDACVACSVNVCGDGIINADKSSATYESCEDHNTDPNDGCDTCRLTRWVPTVLVGQGESGGDPLKAPLIVPTGLVIDRQDNVYVATDLITQLFRLDHQTGRFTHFAGSGVQEVSGDGGPARAAGLGLHIVSLAVDRYGSVYVGAYERVGPSLPTTVRRIDAGTGTITTVVGGAASGALADGVGATGFRLLDPGLKVALDGLDEIVFSTSDSVYRVDPATGLVHLLAGGGATPAEDGVAATTAALAITGLALDSRGRPVVIDDMLSNDSRVFRLPVLPGADPTGAKLELLAGGVVATPDPLVAVGDGGPARAASISFYGSVNMTAGGLAFDAAGTMYVAESTDRVRRVVFASVDDPASGTITTVAGGHGSGFSGDGGLATAAQLWSPTALAVDREDQIWLADGSNTRVRVVSAAGVITTRAGNGNTVLLGDGGSALAAALGSVYGLVIESPNRALFLQPGTNRMRRVDCADATAPWTCTVDTVLDLTAENHPGGIGSIDSIVPFPDGGGDLLATTNRGRFVRLHPPAVAGQPWQVTSLAGTGAAGPATDGPFTQATFGLTPENLVLDGTSYGYFSDVDNLVVRRIALVNPADPTTWTIATVMGDGTLCDRGVTPGCGDGGPARSAKLAGPYEMGIAIDAAHRLYFDDGFIIRRVTFATLADPLSGTVETIAGNGLGCAPVATGPVCGDGGPALSARLGNIWSLAFDAAGRLFIGTFNGRIRVIDTSGNISTFMGDGSLVDSGDGGPPGQAQVREVPGMRFDAAGALWIAGRRTVRKVVWATPGNDATATVVTLAGDMLVGDGPLSYATLGFPAALADVSPGRDATQIAIADGGDGRVRLLKQGSRSGVTSLVGYARSYFTAGASPLLGAWARAEGQVAGVAFDPAGNALYVANRTLHVLERVDLSGAAPTVTILSGTKGVAGYHDGSLAAALWSSPAGLAWDGATKRLYVADSGNHLLRYVDVSADQVVTLAGTPGRAGFFGEADPAQGCLLSSPGAVLVGPSPTRADGSVFVSDTLNHRVRRIDLDTGLIATVMGTGAAASAGDGGPAFAFSVDTPGQLALDGRGNLFVASRTAVRLVTAVDGVPDGLGSVLTVYGAPPRTAFPESVTTCVSGLLLMPGDASVLVSDACAGLLLRLDRGLVPP